MEIMKIGYIRISSRTQSLARQLATMKAKGIEDRFLFQDVASGKNFDRPGYLAMKSVLRPGDCLYLDALDRLGRNYENIIQEWKYITREMGCDIVALDNEALFDSRRFKQMGEIGRMLEDQLLAVLAYVADNERRSLLERQRKGISAAKAQGIKFGRPSSISDWELFDRTAKRWVLGEISAADACRITGAKKTSWYKYTKERGFKKNDEVRLND